MKYGLALFFAWLFAVLNVSAMPYLKVLGVTPDFVLIFACCWAVVRGEDEAMYVVPIAAVMRDLMSSDPVGTSLLAFAPILFIAVVAKVQVLDTDFLPTMGTVFAATVCFELIHALVLAIIGQNLGIGYVIFRVVIPGAVVNSLFAPLIYLPVRWSSPRGASVLRGAGRLTSPL